MVLDALPLFKYRKLQDKTQKPYACWHSFRRGQDQSLPCKLNRGPPFKNPSVLIYFVPVLKYL